MSYALAKRRPRLRQRTKSVHLPAPMGGINTVDVGSAMPPTDCVYLYNLIASELGLRSRLGYAEWATGLTGESDNAVPSMLPFVGSAKNGSGNRLFATTSTGIWDVSAPSNVWAESTDYGVGDRITNGENIYLCVTGGTSDVGAGPSGTGTGITDGSAEWDFDSALQPIEFSSSAGDAGFGVSCVCATPGGRFLLYCDEENGLHIYTESSGEWAAVEAGATQEWEGSTEYLAGDAIVSEGNEYTCATPGESDTATTGGPSTTGTGIADGSDGLTWDYVGAADTGVIGPSLADQHLGYEADPANFVAVCVWKSRVWLVERDTSRAWYLDINSVFGTVTSFDFGQKMGHGGPLRNLYNWSYDAGSGMDTLLVGISGAGDVVIYGGTDPTDINTFGLRGCWFVGGVPSGRNIATDYGGDLLILSLLGAIPISRLVQGAAIEDSRQYQTHKITNLFALLAATYKDLPGWAVHIHPTDNALLLTIPTAIGAPTTQLAMALGVKEKAWSQYRDLPIYSACVWDGTLYFGTVDGRVCRNEGYLDNVQLSDPNVFSAIKYSLLTAYQNLGNARMKRIHMLRPTLLSQTPSPLVEARARLGFNLSEPPPPSLAGSSSGGEGTWDASTWDESVWGGESSPSQKLQGAFGVGRDIAIAVRGEAISRTTLVGVDVFYDEGGLL